MPYYLYCIILYYTMLYYTIQLHDSTTRLVYRIPHMPVCATLGHRQAPTRQRRHISFAVICVAHLGRGSSFAVAWAPTSTPRASALQACGGRRTKIISKSLQTATPHVFCKLFKTLCNCPNTDP